MFSLYCIYSFQEFYSHFSRVSRGNRNKCHMFNLLYLAVKYSFFFFPIFFPMQKYLTLIFFDITYWLSPVPKAKTGGLIYKLKRQVPIQGQAQWEAKQKHHTIKNDKVRMVQNDLPLILLSFSVPKSWKPEGWQLYSLASTNQKIWDFFFPWKK